MDEEPIENEPLDDDEREMLRQDLLDVEMLKELLEPKGIRGTVFYCPDCSEDHFLGWELLAGNLKEMLEEGDSPVHEPAFDPNPDEYVSWDYARGYLDGYESFEEEELSNLSLQLDMRLRRKGWTTAEIKELMAELGLQSPSERERRAQD